uniref:Uncharacterized protein n=1 Tax=Rhizophora mucronata TaxID=61149 RepID=A0A2P2J5L3_RHIMU
MVGREKVDAGRDAATERQASHFRKNSQSRSSTEGEVEAEAKDIGRRLKACIKFHC